MKTAVFLFLLFISSHLHSQECTGGEIRSHEAFLYGRFEVSMQSAAGDGVISSFFLYNVDLGCNWPEQNNEIDIEMTGNSENVLFTTHYPGPIYYTSAFSPAFNPHDSLHNYIIEWEPGIVRWFVDGALAFVQDQAFVDGLIHPMRLMMNLWAVDNVNWAGQWDPSIMPVTSSYDYVRYYEYTPGAGNTGTNNNFTFKWQDDFDSYDESLWKIEEFGGFSGNFCTFKPAGVAVENGLLTLTISEPDSNQPTVDVGFTVDMSLEAMEASDVIYLNGSFNDWCGTCTPMTKDGDVWSTTLSLLPGKYEYLFTKNFWEENGGAPEGSSCDFNPCDEWLNYGVIVNDDSDPIVMDTVCWKDCRTCESVLSIYPRHQSQSKKVVEVYDMIGRKVKAQNGQLLIYRFEDGSIERSFKILD